MESADPSEYQKGVNLVWLTEDYTLLEQSKARRGLAFLFAPDQTVLDTLCDLGDLKTYREIFTDSDCLLKPSIDGLKCVFQAQNFDILNFIMERQFPYDQPDEMGLFKEALKSNNVQALQWMAQKYMEIGLAFPPSHTVLLHLSGLLDLERLRQLKG